MYAAVTGRPIENRLVQLTSFPLEYSLKYTLWAEKKAAFSCTFQNGSSSGHKCISASGDFRNTTIMYKTLCDFGYISYNLFDNGGLSRS